MARREAREADAPTTYPLGHPRNPKSQIEGSAAPVRKVPTPHPTKSEERRAAAASEETQPMTTPPAQPAAPAPVEVVSNAPAGEPEVKPVGLESDQEA